jgi:hypothetical protein
MKLHEVLDDITLQEEDQSQYKSENFIRWGGLSATPHDLHYKNKKGEYHTPPTKSGIFCFLSGYVEHYLYAWKMDDEKGKRKKESHLRRRNFSYRGKIWTHVKVQDKDVQYYKQKGSWYETDTDSLRKIFSKYKEPKSDADRKLHYEVYIEQKHLGGI